MHELCTECYNDDLTGTLTPPRYCREYSGYGSFMLNASLFFSVPNKCASQYMNQLAFSLMEIPKSAIKKGSNVYSIRSAVQNAQRKFQPGDFQEMCENGEKVLTPFFSRVVISVKQFTPQLIFLCGDLHTI